MQKLWIPFVAGALAFPALAVAEPQFTADDIVKHFAAQKGDTRAVVIGDPSAPKERGVFVGAAGFGNEASANAAASQAGTTGEAPLKVPLTGTAAGQQTATATATATQTATATSTAPVKSAKQAKPIKMPPKSSDAYDLLVTFHVDSDRLTSQAQRNLDEFAEALQRPELSGFRFAVDGHTDATGPDDYNLALSERRAASVVSYLTGLGIDGGRLQAKGYGEARPLMRNPRHPGNRRVETRRLQ